MTCALIRLNWPPHYHIDTIRARTQARGSSQYRKYVAQQNNSRIYFVFSDLCIQLLTQKRTQEIDWVGLHIAAEVFGKLTAEFCHQQGDFRYGTYRRRSSFGLPAAEEVGENQCSIWFCGGHTPAGATPVLGGQAALCFCTFHRAKIIGAPL